MWARPGVNHTSATRFPDGSLYVFSSNATPFEPERVYQPFSIRAILDHGGDFTAAAKALAAEGYGEQKCQVVDQQNDQAAAAEVTQVDDPAKQAGGKQHANLAVSWAEFDAEQFKQGERIAFAVERGEIALLNALPNAGKTTLALNVAASLAAGRQFPPLVMERKARKVLYVDGETRRARLQRDLRTMTKDMSREEVIAVGQNLHIICEAEIKGEALALTRTDHLLQLSVDALRVKPDFIVMDTLSSLCPVLNENDNAEQTRRVWRPLPKIARDCDAAMLVNHHVGKRSEDSQAPERVYRGRGASASGGAARAVWLLIPDPVTPGLSTLSCVKAKGETPADVRLQLDPATRWIKELGVVAPSPTPLALVVAAVTKESTTAAIVAAFKGKLSARAVKDYIAKAVDQGLLTKIKRGVYSPKSAESAESAKDENAQRAQRAQSKGVKSAESAGVIGGAQRALSRKSQEINDLDESADCAPAIDECTSCTLDQAEDFHDEPEIAAASVPFMLTRDQKQQLADLGYKWQTMTPAEGQAILQSRANQ